MARSYDFAVMKKAWATAVAIGALVLLSVAAYVYGPPSGASINVPHSPLFGLKVIVEAERNFMKHDRDANGLREYWVGDVAGLYSLIGAHDDAVRLISPEIACLDANPVGVDGGKRRFRKLSAEPSSSQRRWKYAVIPVRWNGESYGRDLDDDGRYCEGESGFAFCAYPATYGADSRHTWIVNETGRIWKRDLGGHPVRQFPANPENEGWTLVTEP